MVEIIGVRIHGAEIIGVPQHGEKQAIGDGTNHGFVYGQRLRPARKSESL